jgi:SAM-dependent methyltransferase
MSLGSRLIYAVIQHQNQRAYAALEKLEFARRALASVRPNAAFRRKHPDFPVPPVYLLWDAQSYTDYEKYRSSGAEAAGLYWQLMLQYTDPGLGKVRVCEWGCGPARIIRHLPELSRQDPRRFEFYGTDYNAASIGWCQRSLPEIAFKRNRLAPPLDFEDGFFDVLFCRSVFTHLSEEMHYAWIRELSRVVKHGGVLMVSTQ